MPKKRIRNRAKLNGTVTYILILIVSCIAIFIIFYVGKYLFEQTYQKDQIRQKYHAFMAPFVPSDFTMNKSTFDYQILDAGTRLTETYSVKRTKTQAFAEVISLFRKHGLRPSNVLQNPYNEHTTQQSLETYIGKDPLSVGIRNENMTATVTLLTFEVSNLQDESLPATLPSLACVGNCSNPTATPSNNLLANCNSYDCTSVTIPSKILLQLQGTGAMTTSEFTTDGDWDLYWNYDCSNSGGNGKFKVTTVGKDVMSGKKDSTYYRYDKVIDPIIFVDQSGSNDNGIEPADWSIVRGTFSFKVETLCSWNIFVKG